MRVVEIFASKQGEGIWTGVPSSFVRFCGCNLSCRFCDTPYAFSDSGEGREMSREEILRRVGSHALQHVVLTGGEPMRQPELSLLCESLQERGHIITIETAGTVFTPLRCDLISISPKLSNSTPIAPCEESRVKRHEINRWKPEVVRRWIDRYDYQLKFVIGTPEDIREMESYLSGFEGIRKDRVLLMPLGTVQEELDQRAQWIVPYCRSSGYRYCPRMHILWFGNKRGT